MRRRRRADEGSQMAVITSSCAGKSLKCRLRNKKSDTKSMVLRE